MKSKKKSVIKKEVPKLINLKVFKSEKAVISKKAKKYAGGNLSLWLKIAGSKYIPKGKDLA